MHKAKLPFLNLKLSSIKLAVINVFFVFILCFSIKSVFAQAPKLLLFLDCETCDEQFLKSEIQIIDYVLDQTSADIHLLVTSTNNGNGGKNFQLVYYGQKRFKGKTEKVLFTVPADATETESRAEVTHRIKLGLVPFIIHTPWSALIKIDMKLPDTSSKTVSLPELHTKDKWDYWVYRVGMDGTYSGEQVYNSTELSGNISANRTTEYEKLHFALYGNYNKYVYKYDDSGTTIKYKVLNTDFLFNHSLVRSIENNISLGYDFNLSRSTFSNYSSRLFFAAGIEFAIIPYKEINTKSFTVSYNWTLTHNKYFDSTIYNRESETLPGQRVQLNMFFKQKWGSMNGGISYSNYFENFSLNNLSANVNLNLRITGGLFFYTFLSGSLIHDQINLSKKGATEQEILSRQRQLASSYNFYSGAGLSYRFGSNLNNFVNPRMQTFSR